MLSDIFRAPNRESWSRLARWLSGASIAISAVSGGLNWMGWSDGVSHNSLVCQKEVRTYEGGLSTLCQKHLRLRPTILPLFLPLLVPGREAAVFVQRSDVKGSTESDLE